jgi:predicted nucleic acid-binding protein
MPGGKRKQRLLETAQIMFTEDLKGKILGFDTTSAYYYAIIAAERRQRGKPISQFDAQIASICRTHQATLATRNVNDFVECQINIINPWDL